MSRVNYKFEVFEDKAGEYRWRMTAPNGQIIAGPQEGYKNRGDCENELKVIIAVVKANDWYVDGDFVRAKTRPEGD